MLIQNDAPGLDGRKGVEETPFSQSMLESKQCLVYIGKIPSKESKGLELVTMWLSQVQVTSWASFPHKEKKKLEVDGI